MRGREKQIISLKSEERVLGEDSTKRRWNYRSKKQNGRFISPVFKDASRNFGKDAGEDWITTMGQLNRSTSCTKDEKPIGKLQLII
jgi:hypothetical protein